MRDKKQRLRFILLVLACLGLSLGLSLYALRDNVSFFYTPHEVKDMLARQDPAVAAGRVFRLGGLVEAGSLQKTDDGLKVRFAVTDTKDRLDVVYQGILPDLFREGQGVVAKGVLDEAGVFSAAELLAKHDEKYMPPELEKSMKKMHEDNATSVGDGEEKP